MKNLILIFFTVMLSVSISMGQDTLQLNFQDAVKMALDKNINLQMEKNNLQSAQALNLHNKALFLPSLGAGSSYNLNTGLQFNQLTGELYSTSSRGANLGVQADYTIFNGFGRVNTIRNSQFLMESQQNNVDYTKQTVIYNVARSYLMVLLDREILRIDKENLKSQQIGLDQIDGFVQTGTKPVADKLTQEATVKKLEVTKIRDENKLRMDYALLSQILMVDPGKNLDIVEPDWSTDKVLAQEYDLNDLYESALANRPDYKKAMNDEAASQAAVGMAKAEYFPTLSAQYQYGSGYTSNYKDDVGETVPFNDQLKRNRSSYLGISLYIPIFTQLKTVSDITRQKVLHDNYQLTVKNLESKVFQDVQTAYLNLVAARNEYYAAQSQYDAADEARKIQQESYELGVSDLVQLSTANQTYVDAAASRAQARYTLLFQKVLLDYAVGTLSPADIN